MAERSYNNILDFLQKYGGNQYKKQEKCSSDEEREFMVRGSDSGKQARELFTNLVKIVSTKNNLLYDRITQWQNSGVFVRYFWCQMKQEAYRSSQISISLFAESADAQSRFRVSVELATEKATAYTLPHLRPASRRDIGRVFP